MIKLDDNLLQELGLGVLPPEEKKRMLAHIYETLEMRVGMELAKQMSDAQLNEFEEFINRNDEAGALRWLETNFPNYKDVVAAEFEKLKSEVKQVAPQIVASSQQAMQQGQGQPMQQPQYAAPAPGYQQQQPVPHQPVPAQQYAASPQPYQNQPYQQPSYQGQHQSAGMPQQQQYAGHGQQPVYPPQQPPQQAQSGNGTWGSQPGQVQQHSQQPIQNQQQYQQPDQPATQNDYDLAA